MSVLPREVIVWLDGLDLAYSVRNPRRDLSNGFVVAEILCRYFPKEMNIYTFDNGLKVAKKTDNWEQIAKFMKKKEFNLKKEEYEPVIYYAEGAAERVLKRLYEFLTKRRYPERMKKADSIPVPHFQRPTASLLSKNTELVRIIDNQEKAKQVVYQLMVHSQTKKQELRDMEIDKYIETKKLKMATMKKTAQLKPQKIAPEIPETGEIKPIELKTLHSAAGKKSKEQAQTIIIEARSALEFIAENAKDLIDEIGKEIEEAPPEEGQEHKVDPNKPEPPPMLERILVNCKEISDDSLNRLFQAIEENLDGIAERLSNNFQDFKKFFSIFQTPLMDLYWGSVPFMSLVDLLKSLGTLLLKIDPTTTEIMFESLILPQMVDIIVSYYNKRESICQIIFSFCLVNSASRQRFLKKIKEHLSQNLKLFIAILSIVVSFYSEEDFTEDLYNLYFYYAIISLDFPSPVTRAQGLKILNEIVYINYVPVIQIIGKLENLSRDQWWEVKALILILCSSLLLYISKEKELPIHTPRQDPNQNSGEALNLSEAPPREEERLEDSVQGPEQNLVIQEEQEQHEEMQEIAQMNEQIKFKTYENEEAFLINLVNSIFRINTNQNVLKIGLIYLASTLNKYPVLCPCYLDILLHIADVIRSSILDINPIPGTEEDYIAQNSFKYKLTGAPLLWNAVGIAEALETYVQEKSLASFERVHAEIFERCLVQPLSPKDAEVWLRIYESLKWHVFVGLCDRDLCQLCSEIVKKFFTYEQIQDEILENSKHIFYKTLTLLYHPDRDGICKENMLDFFEFLQQHETNKFKEYIYGIIKEFSEKNKDQFLQSNLVDFMNMIAKQRREELFGSDILQIKG